MGHYQTLQKSFTNLPSDSNFETWAQEWTNRTEISHVHFLELPCSLVSITEITEYLYFSLIYDQTDMKY